MQHSDADFNAPQCRWPRFVLSRFASFAFLTENLEESLLHKKKEFYFHFFRCFEKLYFQGKTFSFLIKNKEKKTLLFYYFEFLNWISNLHRW